MATELSAEEVHSELEWLLENIIRFCEANDLRYFLSYGSLLGAIREGKIIPWDDDIDIMMPRPDYDRLLELYNEQPEPDTVLLVPGSKDYPTLFAKLISLRTTFISPDFVFPEGFGLFLDIFPIDAVPAKGGGLHFALTRRAVNVFGRAYPHLKGVSTPPPLSFKRKLQLLGKTAKEGPGTLVKGLANKTRDHLATASILAARMVPRDKLAALIDWFASIGDIEKANHVADLYGNYSTLDEARFDSDHLKDPMHVNFGGTTVSTFAQPEKLLHKWYGPNWRIPDPNYQRSHGTAYWVVAPPSTDETT